MFLTISHQPRTHKFKNRPNKQPQHHLDLRDPSNYFMSNINIMYKCNLVWIYILGRENWIVITVIQKIQRAIKITRIKRTYLSEEQIYINLTL